MRGKLLPLAATVALLLGCGGEPEAPEPVIRPVRTIVVQSGSGESSRVFSGVAQAGEQSRLSFRVPGMIRSLPVKVGDRVTAGALIAQLDSTDFEIQLREAQTAMTQARAQQRNAEATYTRVRALYENENASRQDLDQARTARETATAAVSSVAQRVQLAQRQIGYCRLTAPADGAISAVAAEQNENVAPGQVVAILQAGEQIEVRVSLPESLITHVSRGDEVTVTFNALGGQSFTGTVAEVGVQAEGSATFPVTVRLPEEGMEEVRAGMAADVGFSFEARGGSARVVVPSVAVGEDDDGRFVYVVERASGDRGVVHRRAVEVGELSSDGLEIRDGLSDGDVVVTAGVSRIHDGLEVKLPESATQAPDSRAGAGTEQEGERAAGAEPGAAAEGEAEQGSGGQDEPGSGDPAGPEAE